MAIARNPRIVVKAQHGSATSPPSPSNFGPRAALPAAIPTQERRKVATRYNPGEGPSWKRREGALANRRASSFSVLVGEAVHKAAGIAEMRLPFQSRTLRCPFRIGSNIKSKKWNFIRNQSVVIKQEASSNCKRGLTNAHTGTNQTVFTTN